MKLEDFGALVSAAKKVGKVHALLGNGFSRACRDDIFSYGALFDMANFNGLSPFARAAFDALGTTDFEVVIQALKAASKLVAVYAPRDAALATILADDANKLREVLVSAIAAGHPNRPTEISPESYRACREFLNNFERVYTLNYDLLLYWAYMQDEIEPKLRCDDGFRTPQHGTDEYVTWEVDNSYNQKIYYLHGALHIFDADSEIQKFTWINTGVPLTEQVRGALEASKFPLFVSEGTSKEKLKKIKHNGYLHRGLASMPQIKDCLVVYGMSFAPNDEHIIQMIVRGSITKCLVSIFGDPTSSGNRIIIRRAQHIKAERAARVAEGKSRQHLDVLFFDAESARVWG